MRTAGGQSGEQFACNGPQLCACWILSPVISLHAEIAKVPSNARERAKFRARIIEHTSLRSSQPEVPANVAELSNEPAYRFRSSHFTASPHG